MKPYLNEQNQSSSQSQGLCHLPGCEARLKKEQRAPKSSWKAHDTWIEPGNNWVIPSVLKEQRSGVRVNKNAEQAVCRGPTSTDFCGHPGRSRDVCLHFQPPQSLSLNGEEGKWCRGGKKSEWNNTWNPTKQQVCGFLKMVVVDEGKWLASHNVIALLCLKP